jgi:hypothetical protein
MMNRSSVIGSDRTMYRPSINDLVDTFRRALIALVPVADRASLTWRDENTRRLGSALPNASSKCLWSAPFRRMPIGPIVRVRCRDTPSISTVIGRLAALRSWYLDARARSSSSVFYPDVSRSTRSSSQRSKRALGRQVSASLFLGRRTCNSSWSREMRMA